MEKDIIKQIILNQQEFISKVELLPRKLSMEKNANYVFSVFAVPAKHTCSTSTYSNYYAKDMINRKSFSSTSKTSALRTSGKKNFT